MGFGVSVKVAPGVRIRATSRGVRASVGPRAARVHVGNGRAGFSTGVGPVSYYTGLGESEADRGPAPRRPSNQTPVRVRSEPPTADKADQIQQILRAEHAVRTRHLAHFPPSQRPFAPEVQPVDVDDIERTFRRQAMANVGWFARERREQARRAARNAAVHVANQQFVQAVDNAHRLQAAYDVYWNALNAHDPDTVVAAVDEAFADNVQESTCVDAGVDTESNDRYVTCVVIFESEDAVPDRMVGTTPTGRPSLRKRSKTDTNNLYVAALGSTVIATAREALAVAPAADEIRMLVVRAASGKTSTGTRNAYSAIYFGVFVRAEMDVTNWQTVDPAEVLRGAREAEFVRKGAAGNVMPLGEPMQTRMGNVLHALSQPVYESWHSGD